MNTIPFFRRLLILTLPLLSAAAVHASVLWSADSTQGLKVFEALEEKPGKIVMAQDPLGQHGTVYSFSTWDDPSFPKERSEARGTQGLTLQENRDYYIGWRAMWNPMPIKPGWVALFQMHGYGPPGQGAPLVLRCVGGDGAMSFQANANGVNVDFWH